jgi:hypothetical protein
MFSIIPHTDITPRVCTRRVEHNQAGESSKKNCKLMPLHECFFEQARVGPKELHINYIINDRSGPRWHRLVRCEMAHINKSGNHVLWALRRLPSDTFVIYADAALWPFYKTPRTCRVNANFFCLTYVISYELIPWFRNDPKICQKWSRFRTRVFCGVGIHGPIDQE